MGIYVHPTGMVWGATSAESGIIGLPGLVSDGIIVGMQCLVT